MSKNTMTSASQRSADDDPLNQWQARRQAETECIEAELAAGRGNFRSAMRATPRGSWGRATPAKRSINIAATSASCKAGMTSSPRTRCTWQPTSRWRRSSDVVEIASAGGAGRLSLRKYAAGRC